MNLETELAALTEALKPRHIGSAPRDGTDILALCDFDGFKCWVVLSFEDSSSDYPWWDRELQGVHKDVPTHWLPLPRID